MQKVLKPEVRRSEPTVAPRPAATRTPAWPEAADPSVRMRRLEHQVQVLGDAVRLLASATDGVDREYARDTVSRLLADCGLKPLD